MANNEPQFSPEDWKAEIFTARVVVMVETHDGYFRQLILDEDQFSKLSDAIVPTFSDGNGGKGSSDGFRVNLSDVNKIEADHFLGYQTYYRDDQHDLL